MKKFILIGMMALISACSTQTINVAINKTTAQCTANNDRNNIKFQAPANIAITKGLNNVIIACEADGFKGATILQVTDNAPPPKAIIELK